MVSQQIKDVLLTLKTSSHGRALEAYLHDRLDSINDVSSIKSWDECLGRQHATSLIKDIFSFLEIEKKTEKQNHPYT